MRVGFLKPKGKKEKFFLGIDIGTEAVKALIFSVQPTAKKEKERRETILLDRAAEEASPLEKEKSKKQIIVLGAGLEYFERYDVFDGRDFQADVMKKAVSKAINQAYQNLPFSLANKELKEKAQKQKRRQLLLSLPANILKARIVSQSLLRNNATERISKTEEKTIIQRVLKTVKEEISNRFVKESGILPEDVFLVSAKILEMKINGYLVSRLKGYQGKNLEFKTLAIFSPKHYLEETERVINDLKLEISYICHLAESLTDACRRRERKNGVFLDVGGEISQIFLVKEGRLEAVQEFKGGGKAFSQTLSQTLGIDEESSRLLKERYANKLLSSQTSKRIKEIFVQEQKIWFSDFKRKVKEIKPKEFLFSDIFLFGGGSLLPEIQEALEGKVEEDLERKSAIDWQSLLTGGFPKVGFIYPRDLEGVEDTTKNLNNPQNVPPLLNCYYNM